MLVSLKEARFELKYSIKLKLLLARASSYDKGLKAHI